MSVTSQAKPWKEEHRDIHVGHIWDWEPIPAFMSREAGARSPVYLKANKKRQTPIQFHSHTCGHFSHQLIQHGSLWIVGGKQTTWRLSSMHRKHMQTPGKRRYSTRYLIFPLLFTKSRRVETMNRLLDLIFLEMISFTFCIIKWNKFIRFGKSVEKKSWRCHKSFCETNDRKSQGRFPVMKTTHLY